MTRRTPPEVHGHICSLCYFDERPDDQHDCLTSWCRCTCRAGRTVEDMAGDVTYYPGDPGHYEFTVHGSVRISEDVIDDSKPAAVLSIADTEFADVARHFAAEAETYALAMAMGIHRHREWVKEQNDG